MFSKEEKTETLERILNSNSFAKSTTANVLLKYLVESSINNKEISASAIGYEIFGAQYQRKKSDSHVRVNIYHLRKKLNKYFEEEGKDDPIHIIIEKGQYGVTFKRTPQLDQKNISKKTWLFTGIGFSCMVILLITFLSFRKQPNKVWKNLFENQEETTLYLRDAFGFDGPAVNGKAAWIREYSINSVDDFYETFEDQPEVLQSYSPSKMKYVSFDNATIIKNFSEYFYKNQQDFLIHKTSEFTTRDWKEKNTIYAGPILSSLEFADLFNKKSKRIKLYSQNKINKFTSIKITPKGAKQDSVLWLRKKNDQDSEYAIASSFKGASNTVHYIFFSNHDIGVTAMVEYFTNEDSLKSFSNKHLENTDEFVAIFYAKGKDRINMELDLVYFDDNQ